MSVEQVLDLLRANLGLGETPAGSNHNKITEWYNKNIDRIGDGPWCEMTVTWAMHTTGHASLKRGRAYTVYAAQDAQKGVYGSRWTAGTTGMRAGDAVYYDWRKTGKVSGIDHVGIVEKINGDGTYNVLEGNYNDRLARVTRGRTYIVGYARPNWAGVVTAPTPVPVIPPMTNGVLSVSQIKQLQKLARVKQDGVWGPNTDHNLNLGRGLAVGKAKALKIRDGQGIVGTKMDGAWGPNTQKATAAWVNAVQRVLGVTYDGEWGPVTEKRYQSVRIANFRR